MTKPKHPSRKVGHPQPPTRNARKSVKNSHTSPERLNRAARIKEALDYRLQGYSYSAIAEQMKLGNRNTPDGGTSTAYDLVKAGLDAIPKESAEKVMEMELERADRLLTGFIGEAINGDDTKLRSVELILNRLDKLRGIVAPAQKLELSGPNGGPIETKEVVTDEDRAKALAAFVAKYTARKQGGGDAGSS